jgi:hypothetical protein
MEQKLREKILLEKRRKKVRRYFEIRKFPFHGIVSRAPDGVGPKAIMKGMENVYDRRTGGEDIPRIRMVREAWRIARGVQVDEVPPEELLGPGPWRTAFIFAAGTSLVFCVLFLFAWLGGR